MRVAWPNRMGRGEPPFVDCGIAVMAKASAAGRTKTRLVPPLTFEEAAAFNTAFLQDIAANLLAAGRRAPVRGYMAFGPPGSQSFFRRHLPGDIDLIEAWLPNFGACLFTTVQKLLRRGHGTAVVLNSDSPTLPTSLLVRTAEILAQPGDRAVIGPAADGGYYLLGLKEAHPTMFERIDWSTERVAEQTMQRARELALPMHVLPRWYDVDDIAALRLLHAELFGGRSFDPALVPNRAANTAALMQHMIARGDLAGRLGLIAEESKERIAV